MEILIDASIIHNIPAAIQRAGEFGINMMAIEASTAPTRKYGHLLPSLFHVLSLICPIIGCTIKPVTGAAIQSSGILSMSAPKVSKILLTFAFCSAKPN